MGDTVWGHESGAEDVVAFVDAGEEDLAEVDGPDAVADLLEADGVLLEGVGEEEEPFAEADRARVRDALDDEVGGIGDRREGPVVGTGRRAIQRGRRAAPQGLVRALVVVEVAEGVEGALLRPECRPRRAGGVGNQPPGDGVMRPLLLRGRWGGAQWLGSESQPPHAVRG